MAQQRTLAIDADSPVTVPNQLLSILLKEIGEGKYAPGQRFPAERLVAAKYGISRGSVRETVTQLITQGVLVRANGRGSYVAERDTRTATVAGARQLGFWIGERVFHFVQAGYNQILSGVSDFCRSSGCRLKFYAVPDVARVEMPKDVGPEHLDGSIIVGGLNRDIVDRLNQLAAPVIFVDLLSVSEAVNVSIDYASGTRAAIDYLAELNHREIGFIGFPNSAKYIAYWQTLSNHGFPYRPQHVEFFDSADLAPGMFAGFRAMQKLLARPDRPTAVVVTNDYAALGAIEALKIAGVAVPSGMSIVGYDDLGVTPTPLTTIRTDLIEVGRTAAHMLLRWIETGIRPPRPMTMPVELVVRTSTGPANAASAGAEASSQVELATEPG